MRRKRDKSVGIRVYAGSESSLRKFKAILLDVGGSNQPAITTEVVSQTDRAGKQRYEVGLVRASDNTQPMRGDSHEINVDIKQNLGYGIRIFTTFR